MANLKDLIVNGSARILGTLYAPDIKNTHRVTEFIVGTQTATTGSWTGVTQDTSLYDGKNINYFLPYAGNGNATLNLTLADGTSTTGAKPVYLWGTSYVTTHYPVNSCINMTYNASKGAWFVNADRDNNNVDRLQHASNIYTAEALIGGKLVCGTKDGYKNVASGVTFDITYPVLYAGGSINASTNSNNVYLALPNINLQTTKASWTGTNKSMVFLVGTLSGTTFTIDSSIFTTTVPTTQDNKVYMPVGILYSTYQCYFVSCRDLYAYRDGSFQKLSTKYVQGSATQPIYFDSNGQPQNTTYTLGKSVPSDAVFTDTVYTHPTTSGNKHIPSGGSSGQFLKWSSDGTATWAADNNTLNTAGSTDTSSKIFLVGATSQAANPQTYSHDTAFVDANGRVNSAAPASDANDTTVATTKWVKDQKYIKIFSVKNSALTVSGGKVTWTVTHNIGSTSIGVHIYEVSSGEEVVPNKITRTSTTVATIELLASANVAANTYEAVVIGG